LTKDLNESIGFLINEEEKEKNEDLKINKPYLTAENISLQSILMSQPLNKNPKSIELSMKKPRF
jgi:hypothetical protein